VCPNFWLVLYMYMCMYVCIECICVYTYIYCICIYLAFIWLCILQHKPVHRELIWCLWMLIISSPFSLKSVYMADTCRLTQNPPKRAMITVRRSAANHWPPRTSEERMEGGAQHLLCSQTHCMCLFPYSFYILWIT